MHAISIQNFTKVYDNDVTALSEVSFNVPKGHIFGLLGPNGAGKTTLIKALLGIIKITKGDAQILGESFEDNSIRKKIGYLPENHKYPLFLTGREVLHYFGSLSAVSSERINQRIPDVLKLVSMEKWDETKIKKYSKGMMQRIGLAQALISDPEILFLDEPTDGIDPVGRREIHDILVKLKEEGKTIFINSHMLAEVESVCDSVAILKNGRLARIGSVEEITVDKEKVMIEVDFPAGLFAKLLNETEFHYFEEATNIYSFQINQAEKLNELIDLLRKNHVLIKAIYNSKSTLEDSFIKVVQNEDI